MAVVGCDPMTVGSDDVRAAAERIAGRIRRTPVLELGELRGASVVAKLELVQHGVVRREAHSTSCSSEVPPAGAIAASGGNPRRRLRRLARPASRQRSSSRRASQTKVDRVRAQGAAVTIVEGYFAEANEALGSRAAETGALLMHPFDQPEVIAGQGTLGIEIEEQVPGRHSADRRGWRRSARGHRGMVRRPGSGDGWNPRAAPHDGRARGRRTCHGPGGRPRVGLTRRGRVGDPRSRSCAIASTGWPSSRASDPRRTAGAVGRRPADRAEVGRRHSRLCDPELSTSPRAIVRGAFRRELRSLDRDLRRDPTEPQAVSASRSSRSFVVVFQFRIVICL